MEPNFFVCEVCGSQPVKEDVSKFPWVRRTKDGTSNSALATVRCAECARFLPFQLKEGEYYRSRFVGEKDMARGFLWNGEYSYLNHGIGHLLEIHSSHYSAHPDIAKGESIELGYMIDSDTPTILLGYRVGNDSWFVVPYNWHAFPESVRGFPATDPPNGADRKFTVAFVNDDNGRYGVIRTGTLSTEFCALFESAIRQQTVTPPTNTNGLEGRIGNLATQLSNGDQTIFDATTTIGGQ